MKFFDMLGKNLEYIEKKNEKKVTKSKWWMPWLSKAMKDVISCDKPRGGANIL